MLNMPEIDLSRYGSRRGAVSKAPRWKIIAWFAVSRLFFSDLWAPFYGLKAAILRLFGARIGKGVVIKPGVRITCPWLLAVGDHVWIGEGAWLDNLDRLTVESHVCISQGAYLCAGNHDWTDPYFGLKTAPIHVQEGSWLAAHSIVGPGVTVGRGAVLTLGSVATRSLEPMMIYAGNPAQPVRQRAVQAL